MLTVGGESTLELVHMMVKEPVGVGVNQWHFVHHPACAPTIGLLKILAQEGKLIEIVTPSAGNKEMHCQEFKTKIDYYRHALVILNIVTNKIPQTPLSPISYTFCRYATILFHC